MSDFRGDDEALLAAALTGFMWAVWGREDKENLIIRGPHRAVILVSRSSIPLCKYGNPSYHPVLIRHYP